MEQIIKYQKMKKWGAILLIVGFLTTLVGGFILLIPGIILYVKGNKGERQSKLQYMLQATSKPSTPSPTPQVEPQPIKPTTQPQEKKADYKITTCRVTGVNHYEDNIMKLALDNSDYDYSKRDLFELGMFDEKIFKYDFPVSKFELEPEPDNPYDNKAIKVLADGEHVGYIKAGSCAHILNIINADKIYKIEGNINGGKYKCLYDNRTDDDMIDDKFVASDLELENDSYPIHVTIEIWECKE